MPLVIASNEPREQLVRQLNAEGYQIVGEQPFPGEETTQGEAEKADSASTVEAEETNVADTGELEQEQEQAPDEEESDGVAVSERGEQKWRGRGKKPGWKARQRINQLVAQRKEMEERLARIEKLIEQAIAAKNPKLEHPEWDTAQATSQPESGVAIPEDREPDPADFDNYESYLKALAAWQANRVMRSAVQSELERLQKRFQEIEEARNREKIAEQWRATLNEYGGLDDETLRRAETVELHPLVSEQLLRLGPKEGPLVAVYLAKHPDEAEKINSIADLPADADPDQIVEASTSVALALGRISALASQEFHSARTAKTGNPAVSRAPRPITPVRGTATRNQPDPDSMSFEEFVKWREQGGNWP